MSKALLVILMLNANGPDREYRYPQETMAQCLEVLKASSTKPVHDIKHLGGGDFEDLDTVTVSVTCSDNNKILNPDYNNSRWHWDYSDGVYIERKEQNQ